jgi:hypothetical protein
MKFGPHPVRQVVRQQVKIDGEDLLIMTESDVLGVIDAPAVATKKAA